MNTLPIYATILLACAVTMTIVAYASYHSNIRLSLAATCGLLLFLMGMHFYVSKAYGDVPTKPQPAKKPDPVIRNQRIPAEVSEAYCGTHDIKHVGCCFMLLGGDGYFMCEGEDKAQHLINLRLVNTEDEKK